VISRSTKFRRVSYSSISEASGTLAVGCLDWRTFSMFYRAKYVLLYQLYTGIHNFVQCCIRQPIDISMTAKEAKLDAIISPHPNNHGVLSVTQPQVT
jgi:hypothetical protein